MLRDELGMRRSGSRGARDGLSHAREDAAQLFGREMIRERIVGLRQELESGVDRQPTRVEERFPLIAHDVSALLEQAQLVLQCVGHRQGAAMSPERTVLALTESIVHDQEIANALELQARSAIEFGFQCGIERLVGEQAPQLFDAGLDERNARRLERLQETARQPERDAVLVPDLLAHSRPEAQHVRLGERSTLQLASQPLDRLLFAEEFAAEDVAIADSMLERNAPFPAGFECRGSRVRRERSATRARQGDRAIARRPVRAIFIAAAQRTFAQQPAKARAVDEQVGANAFASLQPERFDEAILATQVDIEDLPIDARYAALHGVLPQVTSEECSVEMQRPIEYPERCIGLGVRARESILPRQLDRERVVAEVGTIARVTKLQPVLVERHVAGGSAEQPERMHEGGADARPILEHDTELGGCLRGAHQLELDDAERTIVVAYRGDRRFAHADRGDVGGLDEGDGEPVL